MEMRKDIARQRPRRLLPDFLENNIAQIVEQHLPETRQSIGRDQRQQDSERGRRIARHTIDNCLIGKGHCDNRALGQQHQKAATMIRIRKPGSPSGHR